MSPETSAAGLQTGGTAHRDATMTAARARFSVEAQVTLIRVVGADKATMELLTEALASGFPHAQIHACENTAELPPPSPIAAAEVLLVSGMEVAVAEKLAMAQDAAGLPRWPVVMLSDDAVSERVEVLERERMSPEGMARALGSATGRHAILRENARLRGDLLTIAGRINHDLKTPLNGILAGAEAMREVLNERDPAAAAMSAGLFNSVEEMVRIMNRVSFMLKASVHGQPARSFPMGDVVWTVMQRFEGKIRAAGLQVIKPEEWPAVDGVETWLEVIWGNLIQNVIQHAAQATLIELGWRKEKDHHVFFIRDDGAGVNDRRRASLFRRFELLHTSETGHGLGLPIVQRLVELQGGRITYQPGLTGGSLFSFTLPCPRALH